ncbi:MAG: homocysteine S-methyltransferase family protein [Clostridia bacterium]|nr:homocysteine S-methyltransferase family protein [Clostridia bacterium]
MKIEFFDGGMGSLLQANGLQKGEAPDTWNLTHADEILAVHKAYAAAGSDYITTNTFGANRLRFQNTEAIVKAGVELAKSAGKKVALDLGPTGKLLKPMGELDFEEAVDVYSEVIRYAKADADAVIIETISDTYEMKAALLAAKESCDLPVFASFIFDQSGRLLTGADVQTAAVLAESLGADVIGVNCGFGPQQFISLVKQLRRYTSLPILAQPNAGLPESIGGKTVYNLSVEEYAGAMCDIAALGVNFLGGCCGTTPEHIARTVELCRDIPAADTEKKDASYICSYSKTIEIGKQPLVIGERINPTGKKRFKQALIENDIGYIIKEATAQADAGAQILDVNTGLPEIDESEMLCAAVSAIQGVTDVPLQIDTADVTALEKALRVYNGKPLLNSVNGKQSNMQAVFPLAKKYGAMCVCLLLDENGIPATAEERLAIARKMIQTAAQYGIEKKDLIFDALSMTISTDTDNALITLDAVSRLHAQGLHTVLGVSNISFGLPNREAINTAFFTLAMKAGLSAAIINPLSQPMMNAYYAFCALSALDEGCTTYIASAKDTSPAVTTGKGDLKSDILSGLQADAAQKTKEMLQTQDSLHIINTYIVPALDEAGKRFENKTLFLPQLLMCADAAKAAFEQIKSHLAQSGMQNEALGDTILIATVEGDVHDIGKNIVKVLLENYGFCVIDLGKDVKCETIVEQTKKYGAKLVGLSALMTTTVPSMEKTIKLLHEQTDAKVMVGGAVLTPGYARSIHADFYGKDAMASVNIAKEFFDK